MAYPTVSAPYGFKPVNLQGGRVYAGSTRMIPISNAYSTALYNGDIVGLGSATGCLAGLGTNYAAATSSITTVAGAALGVFVGCEYSTTGGPIYGKNRYQYWAGSAATNDAIGYVVDDPLAYFRVAVTAMGTSIASTGTTIGYVNPSFIGSNMNLIGQATGQSTATGDSLMSVSGTVVGSGSVSGVVRTTINAPFRVIQVVPDTAYTYVSSSTSTTSSGTSMTISAADLNIKPGMQFIATASNGTYVSGCAPGNYNTVVTNAQSTTIVLSGSIGASLSGATLSFVGYPEVIVGWNPTFHSYNIVGGY